MSQRANATFEVKSWNEKPYDEMEGGPKLTRALVAKAFRGDLEGESTLKYLMVYRQDGTATFVGIERFVGTLTGRAGSFVLQHEGSFANGTATTRWRVVPGSGTGQLLGLRGEGGFAAGHAEQYAMTLDFDFE